MEGHCGRVDKGTYARVYKDKHMMGPRGFDSVGIGSWVVAMFNDKEK